MTIDVAQLTDSERRGLRLLEHGDAALAGRTDTATIQIHTGAAKALVRKGLAELRYRGDVRVARLTREGREVCRALDEVTAVQPPPEAPAHAVRLLPIADVYANPKQPRTIFDDASLDELGASIREHGLLQPIKVRADADGRFMIVMGERRWRAHQRIGAETILAMVVEASDDDLADAAIVENLQRKDITPLEEAYAFQRRLDAGLTIEELARRLGIKQLWRIADRVALLRLTPELQDALAKGYVNPTQAYEMSRLVPASQRVLFNAIRSGRCKSNAELRRVVQELLDMENQTEMFGGEAGPTEKEKRAARGLEEKIEQVCALLRAGFQDNEVVVLRRVNPLGAEVLADKLGLIESSLKKLRLDLRAAAIVHPIREMAGE